jgi:hypothetical protein
VSWYTNFNFCSVNSSEILIDLQSFGNSFVPCGGGGLESKSAIAEDDSETDGCLDDVRGDGGTLPRRLPLLGCDERREVPAAESEPVCCWPPFAGLKLRGAGMFTGEEGSDGDSLGGCGGSDMVIAVVAVVAVVVVVAVCGSDDAVCGWRWTGWG